ncbi:Sau3AI family type II restriction endonuclease [Sulfurospirillum barnesii]|uniref:DNA mismatch repair enzyme MutH n=1 Tax=Sulfurospirillum barnesii (strain ATCC 700032 / DSM 10660 / SES-3) TaxID=760154 RepID=I3XY39_SULBS|nr:Sau3AI family type II restriction endonuclease [Sulfurospirillum barnesii]AFL68863.1 DNA mismatch repair enzyme MutH [Sulfurospirillum barnesii SES-3]
MSLPYDITDKQSIINFAKKLLGKTLRDICDLVAPNASLDKGSFGKILEKFYFLYEPNSDAQPDFKEAKLELKSTPLKQLKKKQYRSKERLVLNIINYMDVVHQHFEESAFLKKNAHLLLIFYLHTKDTSVLDYVIKLVDEWKFPDADLEIIRQDWEFIQKKIRAGKAHELSEGDTFYLGACSKGATAQTTRQQPYNTILAKQRAYSLKQGYVNHIIASLAKHKTEVYGKLITQSILHQKPSIEEIVIERFTPYYNQSLEQILEHFDFKLNRKSKNFYANLTKAILKIDLKHAIEEFEKADIIVKTVRLKENNLPKEDVSFPAFEYTRLLEETWEESEFKAILEHKFLFVFFQFENNQLFLRKVKFWNMPHADIEASQKVWLEAKRVIQEGNIVKKISNKRYYTHFPSKKFSTIAHVRPHAKDKDDTYPLPTLDQLTDKNNYMKHSFWLNNQYIKDKIYLLPKEVL